MFMFIVFLIIFLQARVLALDCCRNGQCDRLMQERNITSLDKISILEITQLISDSEVACRRKELFPLKHNTSIKDNQGKQRLFSHKYNQSIDQFCTLTLNRINYAVGCSPCKSSACVELCCPVGHIFQTSLKSVRNSTDHNRCTKEELLAEGLEFYPSKKCVPDPRYPIQNTEEFEVLGFQKFTCPTGQFLSQELFFGFEPETSRFNKDGHLELLNDGFLNNSVHNSEFCLGHKLEDNGEVTSEFLVCSSETTGDSEFVKRFYPVSLFISAMFMLLTIFIYIFLGMYKHNYHRNTLGFLISSFISYLFLFIQWVIPTEAYLYTTPCAFIGYMVQYTFLSIFFWITAMALDITKMVLVVQTPNQASNNKHFYICVLIAQGCPAVVCIVTALMDSYGSCSAILPYMAEFRCFLGSEKDGRSFYQTAEFVYFHGIVLFLICLNCSCFLITIGSLMKHWRNLSRNRVMSSNDNNKAIERVKLVLRFLIIMGVPWVFMIISAFLEHNQDNRSGIVITLDVINLFTGISLFVTLVVKKTIYDQLKNKFSSLLTSSTSTTSEGFAMWLRKKSVESILTSRTADTSIPTSRTADTSLTASKTADTAGSKTTDTCNQSVKQLTPPLTASNQLTFP